MVFTTFLQNIGLPHTSLKAWPARQMPFFGRKIKDYFTNNGIGA